MVDLNARLKKQRKKSGAELEAIEGAVKAREGIPFIQPDSLPEGHDWGIYQVRFNLPKRVLANLTSDDPMYQVTAPDPVSAAGIACAAMVPLLGACPLIRTVTFMGPAVIQVPTQTLERLKEVVSPEMRAKISGLEEKIVIPDQPESGSSAPEGSAGGGTEEG